MADATHAPIAAEQRLMMNVLAEQVDNYFNPDLQNKEVAFVILTAKFGQIDGGRVNYISNAQRADTVCMLKEILARFEGRIGHEGETSQ